MCEDQSEAIQRKLSSTASSIFEDLQKENLVTFMTKSENEMFQDIALPDTKCVLIGNMALDQFTHYNFPRCFT